MIRVVSPADVSAITDIYNEYVLHSTATFDESLLSIDDMREHILHIADAFPYFVYEIDGRVVGYCFAHRWKPRSAYNTTLETTVYVAPDSQRKGVGRQLMEVLIDECRSRGYKTLIACITAGNEVSIALHRKLGFVCVSHFERVGIKFDTWLDVEDYQLHL